jgi:hypothetical protein
MDLKQWTAEELKAAKRILTYMHESGDSAAHMFVRLRRELTRRKPKKKAKRPGLEQGIPQALAEEDWDQGRR